MPKFSQNQSKNAIFSNFFYKIQKSGFLYCILVRNMGNFSYFPGFTAGMFWNGGRMSIDKNRKK
jgi:hypothetical protein